MPQSPFILNRLQRIQGWFCAGLLVVLVVLPALHTLSVGKLGLPLASQSSEESPNPEEKSTETCEETTDLDLRHRRLRARKLTPATMVRYSFQRDLPAVAIRWRGFERPVGEQFLRGGAACGPLRC